MRVQLIVKGGMYQAVQSVRSHGIQAHEAKYYRMQDVTVVYANGFDDAVVKARAWYEEWRDMKTGPMAPGDLTHWAVVES